MKQRAVIKGLVASMPAAAGMLAEVGMQPNGQGSESRQHRVDVKAFTGRGTTGTSPGGRAVPAAGGSRLLRDALAAVARVHGEMIELARLTQEVLGRDAYLCLHRRTVTQQLSLRWRRADAASAHVPWPQVPDLFHRYSPAMSLWYLEADQQARALNQREKASRYALKHARREAAVARSGSRRAAREVGSDRWIALQADPARDRWSRGAVRRCGGGRRCRMRALHAARAPSRAAPQKLH
ncbi:MAG: hypothetical protein U5L01_15980 [Rheinheimera sp.]|nr:hypothetical protein [Rheinheimera sp.]